MTELLTFVVTSGDRIIIWYFLALNSFYALLILLSVPELWKHWQITHSDNLTRYLSSEALPPISGSCTARRPSSRSSIRSMK
jgi:hypothetical protein